jgi:hypothetical protein
VQGAECWVQHLIHQITSSRDHQIRNRGIHHCLSLVI